jgi:hypothetical protein
LHPISLLLYSILYKREPLSVAAFVAEGFMNEYTSDVLPKVIEEIELELKQPTQNVREILGNRQSEEECREFLSAVVTHILIRSETKHHDSRERNHGEEGEIES